MARATQLKKPTRRRIVGGVDTHADTHHAAVLLMNGGRVADAQFGAGLTRHLHAAGMAVVEVNRPDRRQRRTHGKSDPLDAYAAAEAVLAGRATAVPKLGTGIVEAIRALHTTRASAVKARTATLNELRALLITAPARLRDQLGQPSTGALVAACVRLRPTDELADPSQATKHALRSLARRYRSLSEEIIELDRQLPPLLQQACPQLLAIHGVGPETAAQLLITIGDNPNRIRSEAAFAALCGVAPLPASSGKTRTKHRLSRSGDRQANRALYMIILVRLRSCPHTRAYVHRRTTQGLSKKDIIRCLKRYLARQIYKTITSNNTTTKDLEPAA